jgi:cytidylate kinase
MAIITISRQFGSGGDAVAIRICEALGYDSFSKEQIAEAAKETTLGKYNVIDYSEDNHEVQTFLDRLFGRTASAVQKIAWAENPTIAERPEHVDAHDTAVLSLTKRAIQASVKAGNMVIVGRGGQVLLRDTPGVLHVRIEAPVEMRIERIKEQLKTKTDASQSEAKLLQAATDIITNRDMASADYIKRYFNVDWNDPLLYHLVLNRGRLNIEQTSQIIIAAVHSLEMQV